MGQETFLGLDIGTSSVKALLVDADQHTLAEASAPLDVSRPHPLWSEQNPDDWVEGVEAAVQTLRRRAPEAFARLAGIGLSGQMHGATFLDAAGRPLRPAILWNDGRSFAECEELTRRVPDFLAKAGNLAMPGFTAPKALWVAKHEPEIFAATKRILLPKDYVRLKLTGEAVSEMSDAAGTLWLDIAHRRWSDELLAASGLTLSHMPALVEGSEVSAYLSPEIASAWGLAGRKIPVARRRRRQRRLGGRRRGDRGRGGFRFARHLGRHLLRHRQICEPAAAHAARLLPRAAGALARHVGDAVGGGLADLGGRAGRARRQDLGLRRRGARLSRAIRRRSRRRRSSCPISPASARRTTTPGRRGCSPASPRATGAEALLFAVMEGVAFSFADGVDVLREADAAPVTPLLVGGGARSGFWGQMIADVTGLEIDVAAGAEAGAALGAARLAMLAAEAGEERAICARPETQRRFVPDPARAALHAPRLARYRALYGAERGTRG